MLGKWSVYKWANNPEKLNSWDKQVRVVDKFGAVAENGYCVSRSHGEYLRFVKQHGLDI